VLGDGEIRWGDSKQDHFLYGEAEEWRCFKNRGSLSMTTRSRESDRAVNAINRASVVD
jgi:hypothetical protein